MSSSSSSLASMSERDRSDAALYGRLLGNQASSSSASGTGTGTNRRYQRLLKHISTASGVKNEDVEKMSNLFQKLNFDFPPWILTYFVIKQTGSPNNPTLPICTRLNHTRGRGCKKGERNECEYQCVCVLCGSRKYGAFQLRDDGEIACDVARGMEAELMDLMREMKLSSIDEAHERIERVVEWKRRGASRATNVGWRVVGSGAGGGAGGGAGARAGRAAAGAAPVKRWAPLPNPESSDEEEDENENKNVSKNKGEGEGEGEVEGGVEGGVEGKPAVAKGSNGHMHAHLSGLPSSSTNQQPQAIAIPPRQTPSATASALMMNNVAVATTSSSLPTSGIGIGTGIGIGASPQPQPIASAIQPFNSSVYSGMHMMMDGGTTFEPAQEGMPQQNANASATQGQGQGHSTPVMAGITPHVTPMQQWQTQQHSAASATHSSAGQQSNAYSFTQTLTSAQQQVHSNNVQHVQTQPLMYGSVGQSQSQSQAHGQSSNVASGASTSTSTAAMTSASTLALAASSSSSTAVGPPIRLDVYLPGMDTAIRVRAESVKILREEVRYRGITLPSTIAFTLNQPSTPNSCPSPSSLLTDQHFATLLSDGSKVWLVEYACIPVEIMRFTNPDLSNDEKCRRCGMRVDDECHTNSTATFQPIELPNTNNSSSSSSVVSASALGSQPLLSPSSSAQAATVSTPVYSSHIHQQQPGHHATLPAMMPPYQTSALSLAPNVSAAAPPPYTHASVTASAAPAAAASSTPASASMQQQMYHAHQYQQHHHQHQQYYPVSAAVAPAPAPAPGGPAAGVYVQQSGSPLHFQSAVAQPQPGQQQIAQQHGIYYQTSTAPRH